MTSFFTGVSEILFAVSVLREMALINTAVRTGDVKSDKSERDCFCIHTHISYKNSRMFISKFSKIHVSVSGSKIDLGVIFWSHSF